MLKIKTVALFKLSLVAPILLLLTGCFSAPTLQLEAYKQSFSSVKTTATDIYLQTENYADSRASQQILAAKNATEIQQAQTKLAERKAAVQARLKAIEIINEFNNVLSALAAGADPKAIESNLNGISTSLKTLEIDKLTALIDDAVPYLGFVKSAVALIDDAIQKQKFEEAVAKASEPISGIINILQKDADIIHKRIVTSQLSERYNQDHFSPLASIKRDFSTISNTFNNSKPAGWTKENVSQLVALMNAERAKLSPWPQANALSAVKRTVGANTPTVSDLMNLKTMIRQSSIHVQGANKINQERVDHANYIAKYKDALTGVKNAFDELQTAIEKERPASIVNFTKSTLELRKAFLKIGKDK